MIDLDEDMDDLARLLAGTNITVHQVDIPNPGTSTTLASALDQVRQTYGILVKGVISGPRVSRKSSA